MITAAPFSPVAFPASAERVRAVRRAKALSWLSIGWMTIEAGVAIVSAVIAGSVALQPPAVRFHDADRSRIFPAPASGPR